ncbi:MAG: ASCH domain-containing protein [Actinobacteria bacterium]|nr:MAG: ASCH domain-containing protein [Actinomycetota bacterium]
MLMPIQPQYANPIIEGRKKVEFRKTRFRTPPSHVVVYASSPVKCVVGYFEVTHVETAAVDSLWEKYAAVGCIGEDDFVAYYGERDEGVVLGVGEVVVLAEPIPLEDLGLNGRPPQSFCYVDRSVLGVIAGLGDVLRVADDATVAAVVG